MRILQSVFLVVAIVMVPVVCIFLTRTALKIGRSLDNINRSLEDFRPQANMLLTNLNRLVEEADGEMQRVGEMTGEVQAMLQSAEESLRFVEETLRSPLVRWGGALVGFLAFSHLFQEAQYRKVKASLKGARRKRRR